MLFPDAMAPKISSLIFCKVFSRKIMDAGITTAAGTCAVQEHAKHLAQLLIQVLMLLQVHHAKVQVQQVQQVHGSIR